MTPLRTDWQRIWVCQGTPPVEATAVIYATADHDLWADKLREYLAEGKKVAVVGEQAQAVVDRYMQSL